MKPVTLLRTRIPCQACGRGHVRLLCRRCKSYLPFDVRSRLDRLVRDGFVSIEDVKTVGRAIDFARKELEFDDWLKRRKSPRKRGGRCA